MCFVVFHCVALFLSYPFCKQSPISVKSFFVVYPADAVPLQNFYLLQKNNAELQRAPSTQNPSRPLDLSTSRPLDPLTS